MFKPSDWEVHEWQPAHAAATPAPHNADVVIAVSSEDAIQISVSPTFLETIRNWLGDGETRAEADRIADALDNREAVTITIPSFTLGIVP